MTWLSESPYVCQSDHLLRWWSRDKAPASSKTAMRDALSGWRMGNEPNLEINSKNNLFLFTNVNSPSPVLMGRQLPNNNLQETRIHSIKHVPPQYVDAFGCLQFSSGNRNGAREERDKDNRSTTTKAQYQHDTRNVLTTTEARRRAEGWPSAAATAAAVRWFTRCYPDLV